MKLEAIKGFAIGIYRAVASLLDASESDVREYQNKFDDARIVNGRTEGARRVLREQGEPLYDAARIEARKIGDESRERELLRAIDSTWKLAWRIADHLCDETPEGTIDADLIGKFHPRVKKLDRLRKEMEGAKADAKTDTPKKSSRKMNADSGACALAFRAAKRKDDTLELKPFVEDWAEQKGKSSSSIYKTLLDNPDAWKADT